MPKNQRFLEWAYEDATKQPHSYIFLDLKAETNENHRVRANILPSQRNKDDDTINHFTSPYIQYVYKPLS